YWRALMDSPKPLIAAVEGFALGGGLELALCADIIIAGEGAKLGLPEVKVGILTGGGGTQKLARLVGRQRAMLLIMTGRMFGAAEALSMGVIGEVAPTGQALPRAIEIAREIAAMPPISIMQIKEIINACLNARPSNCSLPRAIRKKECAPSWKSESRSSKGNDAWRWIFQSLIWSLPYSAPAPWDAASRKCARRRVSPRCFSIPVTAR